ncbi:hypothetical protein FRC12_006340 [Ceratobasidium sp. 428]|nr:hypothetical protein FRC12_006340 [Ceratobasidium sp. 428]
MYEQWSNMRSGQANKFPTLTICAYLESDNPRPAQFIFDILREHLGSQAEGFARSNEAMSLTLWRADWESGARIGLIKSLHAISNLFEDRGYCSQQLKRAIETSQEHAGQAIMSCDTLLAKDYFKMWGEETSRESAMRIELLKNLQRLWRIEHPVSFSKLALSRMLGSLVGLIFSLTVSSFYGDSSFDRRLSSQVSVKVEMLSLGSSAFTSLILDELEQSDAMIGLFYRTEDIVSKQIGGSLLVRVLDKLASNGVLLPSEVSLVLANWLNAGNLAALLASLAAPGLNDTLSSLIQPRQTEIQLTLGDPEPDNKRMTVEEFQETYVRHRIATHAKRVALHQLAAEKFVIEDMEEAMREAWKGMPSGFVAVALAPVDEVVEATEGACND